MHIQRLTFERVLSVVRHEGLARTRTDFGFETAGLKVFSAQVGGLPDIPVGVPLAVATPEPAAWRDMLGWANLMTGEVAVAAPGMGSLTFELVGIVLAISITAVTALDTTLGAGRWALVIAMGAAIVLMAHGVHGGLRRRRARALLKRWMHEWRAEASDSSER